MTKATAKKICIVVSSLGGGGAEKSAALLSEVLFELGNDIHIISVLDRIDYSYKGKLLNLGELKAEDDTALGRLKRLFVFKNYLKDHKFDYVIDSRPRRGFLKELMISKIIYNPNKVVYCVRSYRTDRYIHPNRFFGRILYGSAYKIVSVSKAISDKLNSTYGFKNLDVIYNPFEEVPKVLDRKEHKTDRFILFYGRLEDAVKNVSLLLNAYSRSNLPKARFKLKILGDGKDKAKLKKLVEELRIQSHVEFLGYKSNPYGLVRDSYFTILTSWYEGFPRVLVESLALGVPVVSVDCKSGPNEIIVNERNGLLVENHNIDALVNAMNRMIEDTDLYLHCKSNAKASVDKFSKKHIGLQWQALLN
ncbi:glycosyltransferase [Winogradskyella sp.]|uniref:glycosyltransferase n=1 Tax=Winogradskyella sp. TaxID=1883156 RepID=UPI00261C6625|nr:glycosyltransferase [Winogradskyella sp.]